MSRVYILEYGAYYSDRGLVVLAAKTKSAMINWIKTNYPKHKRKKDYDIYFECDESGTWLKCDGEHDRCPLIG